MNRSTETPQTKKMKSSPDTMPAYCTGITTSPVIDRKPVLCKECRRCLDENAKDGDLCYYCIRNAVNSKRVKRNSQADSSCASLSNSISASGSKLEISPVNAKHQFISYPTSASTSKHYQFNGDNNGDVDFRVLLPDRLQNQREQLKRKRDFPEHQRKKITPKSPILPPSPSPAKGEPDYVLNTPPILNRAKRKIDFPESSAKRFQPSPSDLPRSTSTNIHLNIEIWRMYWERKQSEEFMHRKLILKDELHDNILKIFPSCGLYIVGSSMTGLGDSSSDMDLCLMLRNSEIDQKKEAINILQAIKRQFYKCNFLRNIQLIHANVPILKFVDHISGIEMDLNINNEIGIRNTQLLSSYARIDQRFPPLVLMVKFWARHHNINDAKHQSLSSYSLVLMVVHYLQFKCHPPVLPCLQKIQKNKYQLTTDIRSLKLHEDLPNFQSRNNQNLGDLFIGFLEYFSNDFNYSNSVMSVRLGTILPKRGVMNNASPKNKQGHWKFICIEEPFDLTNTARAVFDANVFQYIRHVFQSSLVTIQRTGSLNYILR